MWRWPLTHNSSIRWIWGPIGHRLKFYWDFCVWMPPAEKKSWEGRQPCERGRRSQDPGPADSAPEERNAIERLILMERDDFPLEQSQDESLKNAFEQVCSIDGLPLQSTRPPSYPYFAILKIGCIEWPRTLSQSKMQPSCWYQKAVWKCFSRRLIVILWQGIWVRQQRWTG